MKAAVIVFPGSNCDRDIAVALRRAGAEVAMVWHKETGLPAGLDLVAIPGGFSFGDYLRCGAIAARSPVMRAVGGLRPCRRPRARGLQRLPGADRGGAAARRADAQRRDQVRLRHRARSWSPPPTAPSPAATGTGETVRYPIAHHDGNYFADAETLARLEGEDRVAFRYADEPERLDRRHRRGALGEPAGARADAAPRARGRSGPWRHRRGADVLRPRRDARRRARCRALEGRRPRD